MTSPFCGISIFEFVHLKLLNFGSAAELDLIFSHAHWLAILLYTCQ